MMYLSQDLDTYAIQWVTYLSIISKGVAHQHIPWAFSRYVALFFYLGPSLDMICCFVLFLLTKTVNIG